MPVVPFVKSAPSVEESMHYLPGDHVYYRTSSTGFKKGTIQSYLTKTTRINQQLIKATPHEPRVLIKNDETGKEQVFYKSDIIEKV